MMKKVHKHLWDWQQNECPADGGGWTVRPKLVKLQAMHLTTDNMFMPLNTFTLIHIENDMQHIFSPPMLTSKIQ